MPTYSYRCANCGHEFDQYQSFTDDALTVCPVCGEPQLRKVFNSIGVSFTGSGFYRNDSRAAESKGASKGTDAAAAPKAEKPAAAPSTPAPSSAPSTGSSSSGSSSTGSSGSAK
ncbi:MAG: FmdB family transcriptional regulator [Microbacteriaceae bacterium]|nr:FmdB family transcriptional regulator [Microbacteriaceae bacterium]